MPRRVNPLLGAPIAARNKAKLPAHFLPSLRMAVYFAESESPDPKKLFLDQWQ